MDVDLSLVSTGDLIAELFSRFDVCAIVLYSQVSEQQRHTLCNFKGEYHIALGLLEDCKQDIFEELKELRKGC